MRDGFDVHHLDGDHENNDPRNLVLIEHTDHMALHNGGTHMLGRLRPGGRKAGERKRAKQISKRAARYARALREYEEHKDKLAAYCAELQADEA